MKSGSKRFIIALALLSLTAGADAQTPREQLDQMVEQLQKTPNDNALRERIIRLGAKVKPVPTVPEEAVKFEGRAQFAFNNAKSADDYLVAAQEYEKAVVLAPWVPGYYSDLCTIYEKAGKLVEAKHNCGFYLAGVVDPAQVTDVKRRIAGLEFGIEKATKQSPGAVQAKQFEGDWYREVAGGDGPFRSTLVIRHDAGDAWRIEGDEFPKRFNVRDVQLVGQELRFKHDAVLQMDGRIQVFANIDVSATVTADGNTLKLASRPLPLTGDQAYWADRVGYTPRPSAAEYRRH